MLDKKKTAKVIEVITNNVSCLLRGTFLLIPQGFSLRLHTAFRIYIFLVLAQPPFPGAAQSTLQSGMNITVYLHRNAVYASVTYIRARGCVQHRGNALALHWEVLVSNFSRDTRYLNNIMT